MVSQILLSRISRQLSEFLWSKHLACVSRTYSQLQPTNLAYFSLLISRQVVGALHCPSTSLVSPGPAPNLSLSRYSRCSSSGELSEFSLSKHLTCVSRTYSQLQPVEILQAFQKHVVSGNQLTSHLQQMTLQPTCQKKVKQNTRHLNQEYSNSSMPLDFTSAMYQPSDHFRTLVQAQHRSRENLGAQYKRSQLHLRWRPQYTATRVSGEWCG